MVSNIYDVDEAGNENRILFWLRLDSWHLCDAAMLFADINPDSMSMIKNRTFDFSRLVSLKGVTYDGLDFDSINIEVEGAKHLEKFKRKYDDIHNWLNDGENERDSPNYWIERALAKKISIPWLNFAIEQGFYEKPKQLQAVEKLLNPSFDKTSNTYPHELDLAIQAWQAVSSSEGKGKPKARIRAWLDSNANISNEAKERIAIIANWEKTGGATSTD
jgi:hypothetical protein